MFSIKINNTSYPVANSELTVLQQCEQHSIYIPRFCYHDRLSIAGNCRMCLVELETSVKPVIACSSSLVANMSIFTNSKTVKKIRENILEFLLINHPLDCPICDQGGECDLQDQSMVFGSDRGRFIENKRSVEDKNFGPYIKTIMTRCIHCTRCIRFFDEVAGFPVIGTMGRGRETEISMYHHQIISSEISGNVIDLCPVGALTSKPYAFTSRPWELTSFETIDILDSLGSNIRVDVKGNAVMRILPKLNENINEEWISDKIRFSYDSLRKERLTFPLLKVITNSGILFNYTSWEIVFFKIKHLLSFHNYNFFIYGGESNDLFSLFLLRYWIDSCINFVSFYSDSLLAPNIQSNYLFNTSITEFSKFNSFFFNNVNLKKEVSVLNIRIRRLKWKRKDNMHISYVGPHVIFNYPYKHLGISQLVALSIIRGKHFICNTYLDSKLCVVQKNNLCSFLPSLSSNHCIKVNTLKKNTHELHYNSLGFKIQSPQFRMNTFNVYYLLNYEKLVHLDITEMNYIIYHGTHGSWNSMISNVILPCTAYMEYRGWFMNLEGRIQVSDHIVYGPNTCKPSIDILFSLIELPYHQNKLNIMYFKQLFISSIGSIHVNLSSNINVSRYSYNFYRYL